MSDKETKKTEAAKERIMSREYKKNDGKSTDWSGGPKEQLTKMKAQSAADKETKKTPMDEAAKERSAYKNDGLSKICMSLQWG